ncbi:hypothetical protein LWI29_008566 [Acer saccharum]|uniref:Uncharacterized protein n=1 Tax=Acer saccharum TaxID=4024 RepID=A0AA39VDB2_ACESA|nr:hypothetical protein LWI29_008566 [Acer saccharum]
MLVSQQKSEEAKLHYEKLVEDLNQQQVSLKMLALEAKFSILLFNLLCFSDSNSLIFSDEVREALYLV